MGVILDPQRHSSESKELIETFNKKIVGQKEATDILVSIVESYQAGFSNPSQPAGNALFMGPTGSGKTYTVESLCKNLFGSEKACIKIDCAEYIHGHEIAKLVGSPPGYLGHRETHPLLTQEALNQFHTDKMKLSVVLFDEIEKASDTLWQLMLGILDKAVLTLGDNRRVDFSKVIVIMTSNLGAREMECVVDGGFGFAAGSQKELNHENLVTIATDAAKKHFTPEFYNRLQHVAVFHTLTEEQIKTLLDIELEKLQVRLFFSCSTKFFFALTNKAKAKVLEQGFSRVYGARHLRRAIDRLVTSKLANLLASKQVPKDSLVMIHDVGGEDLEFTLVQQ